MRKTSHKISLHRETLRHLQPKNLAGAAGGTIHRNGPFIWISNEATACDIPVYTTFC